MFKRALMKFIKNEDGLETIEYAVMTAIILGALILSIVAVSNAVIGEVDDTTSHLSGI